jgi:4-hydroxy-tetrahydrodipicolinate synthase
MFKGSIVALITPFTAQGAVDFGQLKDLVSWHMQSGTDAIVCCGTTGESPTLSLAEQLEIFRCAVAVSKRNIPIIAGTGTYSTQETVERTKMAKEIGVDGCLVVVPYYNRPSEKGCLLHYIEVSKVGLPTIIYHHPGRTGVTLSSLALAHIAELPNVVGIKDAAGSLESTQQLRALTHTAILCGDDSLALPMKLLGATGVISIVANIIPKTWKAIFNENNEELYKVVEPLCHALVLETNPQGIKYAMSLIGRSLPHLRLPLIEPEHATQQLIKKVLDKLKIEKII